MELLEFIGLHPLQSSNPSLTTSSSIHTNQVKTVCVDLSWGHFNFPSTSQNTHLTSKVVISAVLAFKKDLFDTPPLSPKSQLSTVPLPDNCVKKPVFQDGSLPFQYTRKCSGKLCTHKQPTKGPQATSKGHTPSLISVATMESLNKPMNFNCAIMVT